MQLSELRAVFRAAFRPLLHGLLHAIPPFAVSEKVQDILAGNPMLSETLLKPVVHFAICANNRYRSNYSITSSASLAIAPFGTPWT
jgi:hypothetical protein